MSFTHLNVSSAFSAHYGVNRPEQLCAAASSMGCESLAITDRDGLYGAIKHIGACISTGIAPIVGVSLEVTADKSLGRVLILAHGNNSGKGWATLCRIISKRRPAMEFGAGGASRLIRSPTRLPRHCEEEPHSESSCP